MNVAGEELELVARGAGVTAEVGLGEVDEDGTQGGEPEDGRGNRQRRCHSRTNSIVGVVTISPADRSSRFLEALLSAVESVPVLPRISDQSVAIAIANGGAAADAE